MSSYGTCAGCGRDVCQGGGNSMGACYACQRDGVLRRDRGTCEKLKEPKTAAEIRADARAEVDALFRGEKS